MGPAGIKPAVVTEAEFRGASPGCDGLGARSRTTTIRSTGCGPLRSARNSDSQPSANARAAGTGRQCQPLRSAVRTEIAPASNVSLSRSNRLDAGANFQGRLELSQFWIGRDLRHVTPNLCRIVDIPAQYSRCDVLVDRPETAPICSNVRPAQTWATITSRCSDGNDRSSAVTISASSGSFVLETFSTWNYVEHSAAASISCRRRRLEAWAALIAPLRTTRKSQATGFSGGLRWLTSLMNASWTTSSGVSHHCRACSWSVAAKRPTVYRSPSGSMSSQFSMFSVQLSADSGRDSCVPALPLLPFSPQFYPV